MIKEIRHTGIVVSDMEKSLEFYRDMLGLEIVRDMNEKGDHLDNMLSLNNVNVRTVKLGLPNQTALVELLEFKSHVDEDMRNFYTIGASHIAFTVENIEKLYSEFSKKNIKFNAPPQKSPDGLVKVTFCKDPDGTPIELVEMLNIT